MNSKGQLFSLDIVIAIALVILAIGLLYKQAELFHYFTKDDSLQSELYQIGLNASNQLVSSPLTTCALVDDASKVSPLIIDYLPHCLPSGTKQNNITKEALGIPERFKCSLRSITNDDFIGLNCRDSVPNNSENVFSIERRVVFLTAFDSNQISKAGFDNCVKNSGCTGLQEDSVRLKVWMP